MSDGRPDPTEPGSDRYVASRTAPVLASIFFALLGATLLVVAVVGFMNPVERASNEDTGGLIIRAVAGIVLGLGGLVILVAAAGNIPVALARRFEVDAAGIHLSSIAGPVDLDWDDIRSIRILARTRQSLGYRSPLVPRSVNRRSATQLEFTLRDRDELEFDQPALEKLRLRSNRFVSNDGYTHGLPILTEAFAPSYDISHYAPQLQRVLERHAGEAYAGAELKNSDPDVA